MENEYKLRINIASRACPELKPAVGTYSNDSSVEELKCIYDGMIAKMEVINIRSAGIVTINLYRDIGTSVGIDLTQLATECVNKINALNTQEDITSVCVPFVKMLVDFLKDNRRVDYLRFKETAHSIFISNEIDSTSQNLFKYVLEDT